MLVGLGLLCLQYTTVHRRKMAAVIPSHPDPNLLNTELAIANTVLSPPSYGTLAAMLETIKLQKVLESFQEHGVVTVEVFKSLSEAKLEEVMQDAAMENLEKQKLRTKWRHTQAATKLSISSRELASARADEVTDEQHRIQLRQKRAELKHKQAQSRRHFQQRTDEADRAATNHLAAASSSEHLGAVAAMTEHKAELLKLQALHEEQERRLEERRHQRQLQRTNAMQLRREANQMLKEITIELFGASNSLDEKHLQKFLDHSTLVDGHHQHLDTAKVQRLLELLDTDHNGDVDMGELIGFMQVRFYISLGFHLYDMMRAAACI
eukprot:COSAG05_NODE_3418_length_2078_cov_1.326427_1_plen_323_part_00